MAHEQLRVEDIGTGSSKIRTWPCDGLVGPRPSPLGAGSHSALALWCPRKALRLGPFGLEWLQHRGWKGELPVHGGGSGGSGVRGRWPPGRAGAAWARPVSLQRWHPTCLVPHMGAGAGVGSRPHAGDRPAAWWSSSPDGPCAPEGTWRPGPVRTCPCSYREISVSPLGAFAQGGLLQDSALYPPTLLKASFKENYADLLPNYKTCCFAKHSLKGRGSVKTFFPGLSRAVGWRPGAPRPRLPRAGGAHAGARAGPRQEKRGSALRAPFRAAEEHQALVGRAPPSYRLLRENAPTARAAFPAAFPLGALCMFLPKKFISKSILCTLRLPKISRSKGRLLLSNGCFF